MTKRPEPLIAIDLVRFGCAAMVMLYHYFTTAWTEPSIAAKAFLVDVAPPPAAMLAAMRFNWIGVQLFFVISGMVIAQSAASSTGARFMQRRVLRLAPAAIVCATISAGMFAFTGTLVPDLFMRWLASVALWPFAPQIDPVYWTIGVEMVFYFAVAALFSTNRNGGTDRLAVILVMLSAGFWSVMLATGDLFRPLHEHALALTLLPHGAFFALGMLLTSAAREGWTVRRLWLFASALCVGATQIVVKANIRAEAVHLDAAPTVPLAIFLSGLALLAAAWALQPQLARYIPPRTARIVGIATYPLYLIHHELGAAVIGALAAAGLGTVTAVGVTIAIMLALTWAIAAWLEPPVHSVMRSAAERVSALPLMLRPTLTTRGR